MKGPILPFAVGRPYTKVLTDRPRLCSCTTGVCIPQACV